MLYEHGRVTKPAVLMMSFSFLQNPVCWAGQIHLSPISDVLLLSFMAFPCAVTSPRFAGCGFTQNAQINAMLLFSYLRALSPVFSPTSVTPPTPPHSLKNKGGVFCSSRAKGRAGEGRGLILVCYTLSHGVSSHCSKQCPAALCPEQAA